MYMCTHNICTQTCVVKIQRCSTTSGVLPLRVFHVLAYKCTIPIDWIVVQWASMLWCAYVWINLPGKVGGLQRCLSSIGCLSFAEFISTTAVDSPVVHQLWLVRGRGLSYRWFLHLGIVKQCIYVYVFVHWRAYNLNFVCSLSLSFHLAIFLPIGNLLGLVTHCIS